MTFKGAMTVERSGGSPLRFELYRSPDNGEWKAISKEISFLLGPTKDGSPASLADAGSMLRDAYQKHNK